MVNQATVYTHIERDNRLRWHPVIVIKLRGMEVRSMTGLKGYYSKQEAEQAAVNEAARLERGAVSG